MLCYFIISIFISDSIPTFLEQEIVCGVHYCWCQHLFQIKKKIFIFKYHYSNIQIVKYDKYSNIFDVYMIYDISLFKYSNINNAEARTCFEFKIHRRVIILFKYQKFCSSKAFSSNNVVILFLQIILPSTILVFTGIACWLNNSHSTFSQVWLVFGDQLHLMAKKPSCKFSGGFLPLHSRKCTFLT